MYFPRRVEQNYPRFNILLCIWKCNHTPPMHTPLSTQLQNSNHELKILQNFPVSQQGPWAEKRTKVSCISCELACGLGDRKSSLPGPWGQLADVEEHWLGWEQPRYKDSLMLVLIDRLQGWGWWCEHLFRGSLCALWQLWTFLLSWFWNSMLFSLFCFILFYSFKNKKINKNTSQQDVYTKYRSFMTILT